MLLELLVGVIDAELLKAVVLEGLEAEDVEQAELVDILGVHCISPDLRLNIDVHFTDDPVEELAIDGLGAGVASGDGLRQ